MKKVLIFVMFLGINITTFAALPPTTPVNKTFAEMFDEVFKNVSRTQATTGIIYERAVPFAQLQNFNSMVSSVDTSSSRHFMQGYFELYNAAFQSFAKLPFDVDSLRTMLVASGNIVDIGILHYKFNTIDSVVASQKLIIVDSVLVGEDTTITASLYLEKTAFVVSPLSSFSETDEVTFRFNNDFYFDNTGTSIASLMVDFDDGLGLRSVLVGSSVFVSYPSIGEKTLQFVATFSNGQTRTGYATINVLMSGANKNPQSNWQWMGFYDGFPGNNPSIKSKITPPNPYRSGGGTFPISEGRVWIYYAKADKKLRKPVLLIDGFDPGNKRRFESHTEQHKDPEAKSIWQLLYYDKKTRHLGEQLLALGYDLVVLDLPDGGGYIEQNAMVCIEVINFINSKLVVDCEEHHPIVVVGPSMGGQIARYALAYMEQNPCPNTNNGIHNVSLYVSFDSPHQGANISLGAQAFLYHFSYTWQLAEDAKEQYDKMICSYAAMQMLKLHFDKGAERFHNTYYENLNTLGYPQHCKNIAASNGSLDNIFNGSAGQMVLHIKSWVPKIIQDVEAKIYNTSNPGPTSNVFSGHAYGIFGLSGPKYTPYTNTTGKCSMDAAPGSYFNAYLEIGKNLPFGVAIPFSSPYHPSHCFMPTTSVLDISGNLNYCGNIFPQNGDPNDLVDQKRIPFAAYWGPEGYNMEHVEINQSLATWLLKEIGEAFEHLITPKSNRVIELRGVAAKIVSPLGPGVEIKDTLLYNICGSDTIYYKNCLPYFYRENFVYGISFPFFPLELSEELAAATWYINGEPDLEGKIIYGGIVYTFSLSFFQQKYIWNNPNFNSEYIIIKAVSPDGTDLIVFKFQIFDNTLLANSAFLLWEEAGIDFGSLTLEGNTISIEADLLENDLILPLPDLDDCTLEVKADDNVEWHFDEESNSIVFASTEECDITAQLTYRCACLGVLNINIRNTSATVRPLLAHYQQPNSQVIVSPDGKSGAIFLEGDEEGKMEECCIPLNCREIAESTLAKLTVSDTNFFATAPHLRIDTVDEVEIFSICFQLDSVACFASFAFETDCNVCEEYFTYNTFNKKFFELPTISLTKFCSGGGILTVSGGNDCGLGLAFRWVFIDKDGKRKVVAGSENSNSISITEIGRYFIEYFNSEEPDKIIYTLDKSITVGDIAAEELPFTLEIERLDRKFVLDDEDSTKFKCVFDLVIRANGNITFNALNEYAFKMIQNGNTIDLSKDIPRSSEYNLHYVKLQNT